MFDPLHQFEIHPLIPLRIMDIDVSFTNSSLFMVLAVLSTILFLVGGIYHSKPIPGRWQSLVEMTHGFIMNLIDETVGVKGRHYFPFIFTLFMFILMGNLIGMIPYNFTFTSHIIVTFGLATIAFTFATLIGFTRHGFQYFKLFVPQGAPIYMLPIIIPIEILSYFSRPVSLSIRLFANMMAGHTMLKVFASFTILLGLFGIAPLAVNTLLTAFEILVAILQAYVFTILTCIYIHDAVHLH
ncbi:MAG: ATP synthase subunit a [uncultured bacterium]|nr:MAG: ATP synthase subunit a [uncultured bacterium]OFW68142.1 MAG: F0F1 ATP synthase subunit A [Alphaproteobacteria bacterium GWC2_42_16]OFW73535.1 MAG: F0F1 ATP synthase subunit A [Alphaproteobacteria bacterium GWA2_41_27]OFW82384.1 MAG: F0F1 ATP synthase subunit A [Alphaproteobacteria bacterium RIFCSPHIGHO2_12_FULL_42_100]OFW86210.1 MAG: F0F1 ATP synthase subunit A [Alphaproteobacteria bacterium RBG_16_42_14]OFW91768.1 MAG: F0F1 ATP synthase subunit A [Alphaproteobacteria bacterium RIFCSPH